MPYQRALRLRLNRSVNRMRFRLLTFGGLRLEADGKAVTGPPAQRRRLALLILLAATDQRTITREKAFGLLWPDQSTPGARRLLSESLYILRRLMGEDVIRSAQDDLVLNPEVLWSDVTAFQDCIATECAEDALRLYRGPFLDGFHLKDAPDFDFWAESMRERLYRQVARAMESVAASSTARGDAVTAAEWWGRLAAHDPYSSRIASRYMTALASAGERARAIQFAAAHTARLRADLGVEPDPEFQATLSALQKPASHPARSASGVTAAQHDHLLAPGASTRPLLPPGDTSSERVATEAELATQGTASARPHVAPNDLGSPDVKGSHAHRSLSQPVVAIGALALLAVAALLTAERRRDKPDPALGTVRALTFEPGIEVEPSISPNGRYVAYAGGTPSRIYLRQQGSRPIALVEPDTFPPQQRPRWSPDGTRLAFDAGRRIFVIPALGGVPQQIVSQGWSPTWAPDGQRIAYAFGDTIFVRDVRGGRPRPLAIVIQPAELAWSPDGRWIALTAGNDAWDGWVHIGNIAQSRIVLVAVDDGRIVEVTDRAAMNVAPTWAPDGRQLLFISTRAGARDIYAVRIDEDGQPAGEPERLSTGLDAHTLAVSPAGDRIVYASYQARVNIHALSLSPDSTVGLEDAAPITRGNQMIESISASPDRRWLYFTSDRSGNSDIWRVPLTGGEPVQVTRETADEFAPEQSPDGEWLAYYSIRDGTRDIWVMPTSSGDPVQLTDDPEDEHSPHWSPDGTRLCYSHHSGASGSLRVMRRQGGRWSAPVTPPDGRGAPNRLLGCVGWLPDGRHMVVQDAPRSMIALMPADGGATQLLYASDPASGRPQPIWVRVDKRSGTIYFRDWTGIWAIDPANPIPRQVVQFDDPTRRSTRIEMDIDGDKVYFSLGDPQADLFVAELSGLRAAER
jgi:Tol biopolymer transport system component/DNA-binding SARP family transcriptional activator